MVRQRPECSFLERSTATVRPHTSLDKTHPVHLSVESTFGRAPRIADEDEWREIGAGDGDRTRNQRLGKPLLYH